MSLVITETLLSLAIEGVEIIFITDTLNSHWIVTLATPFSLLPLATPAFSFYAIWPLHRPLSAALAARPRARLPADDSHWIRQQHYWLAAPQDCRHYAIITNRPFSLRLQPYASRLPPRLASRAEPAMYAEIRRIVITNTANSRWYTIAPL